MEVEHLIFERQIYPKKRSIVSFVQKKSKCALSYKWNINLGKFFWGSILKFNWGRGEELIQFQKIHKFIKFISPLGEGVIST